MSHRIWMKIAVGTHKTVAEVYEALAKVGCQVSHPARELVSKVNLGRKSATVELVRVIGCDLGYQRGIDAINIYESARSAGFVLCPAEVAIQLALLPPRRAMSAGDVVSVGMDPLVDDRHLPQVFTVRHDGTSIWLDADLAMQGCEFSPFHTWIFACRKAARR